MASSMVTLVIHGTFARPETWWRLGRNGMETFADRLEARLASHGLEGTVWQPVLDAGMTEEDFAWSGENRHTDRVHGAKHLAKKLGELADRLGATDDEPLEVNLVAHSHGGNVALEMLKHLPSSVSARRVTMLGTPLMWRIGSVDLYPIVASLLLFVTIVGAFFSGVFETEPGQPALTTAEVWLLVIISLIVLPLLLGPYLLVIERPFVWSERALAWLVSLFRKGGTEGTPAYGPPAERLPDVVEQPPILLTSREDEADLALHIGASPKEVYGALVKGQFTGVWRFVELLLLRGPFSVMVAPIAEALTEHFVLGFSWWHVLFNDYEMVNFQASPGSYGGSSITRVDVSEALVPALVARLSEWRPTTPLLGNLAADMTEQQRHIEALGSTIRGVATDIRNQMQLRHTVYYETDYVVDRVAELIAR